MDKSAVCRHDRVVSLEARTTLYSRLVEVLGDASAATLMSYLPGSVPATAVDLNEVEGRLTLRFDPLEQRMDRLEQRMDRLEQRMDRLEQRMDRFEQGMIDFHSALREMSDRFNSELRAQTRTVLLASFGSIVTLGAAIVGVAVAAL